jgi:hypothetical protein
MKSLVIHCRNRDGIDAIRITIKIALVTVGCTVSAGKYEDGSFSTAAVVDTFHNCALDDIIRAFH